MTESMNPRDALSARCSRLRGACRTTLAAVLLLGAANVSMAAARETRGAQIHPQDWAPLPAAWQPDAKLEGFVSGILAAMTVEEKVGQLLQADIASVTPEEVRNYHLGSILAGGNAAPGGDVRSPAARWLELADAYFQASLADSHGGHPPIPVLFGIDAVHGHARIPGATVFPHNVGLGAAHDPSLIERIGRATAEEVATTGIDWTFAPTVAVVRDVRWGRSYESYSEDPALVASYAGAMVAGLQGRPGSPDFMASGHTLASVKHFVGDGSTDDGRDQFDSRVDERALREVHAAGYPAAIAAGALIVMASYNSWHGEKMHASRALLTGVLKERWAFPGFIVGDWNAQEEVPGCTKFDCAAVLNAGLDMYMAPDSWKQLRAHLLEQVGSGAVPVSRLDDAVRRILRVKAMAGLFGKAPPRARAGAGDFSALGSASHRELARAAVRESLVLLKNNGHLLPLDPHGQILVAGDLADDIGAQCGGWTIDWQGAHNTNADFPGATSIFSGIRTAVESAGGHAQLSRDGSFVTKPAAAIVVFGETPYSEFEGDRETLEFAPTRGQPLETLRRLRAAGVPVVSVFLSGRPLWVNREINASDAFVAAWLPGSEGAGVADLLFQASQGGPAPEFSGRLAFSWPATVMPVRFDATGVAHGALFARGGGLSLSDGRDLGALPEERGAAAPDLVPDSLFRAGHVTAPWSIYVSDPTAEVRLTMSSQASPARAVTVERDRSSVHVAWSGAGIGEFRIGGRARNFDEVARGGGTVVLRYRISRRPAGPVRVGIRCEAPYGAAAGTTDWRLCGASGGANIDVTQELLAHRPGQWHELSVPLACFQRLPADLSNVNSLLALETAAPFELTLSEARLEHQGAAAACPGPKR